MPEFPAGTEKKRCNTKKVVGLTGKARGGNRRVTDAFVQIPQVDTATGVSAIQHRTATVVDPNPTLPKIVKSAENSGARFPIAVLNSLSLVGYSLLDIGYSSFQKPKFI